MKTKTLLSLLESINKTKLIVKIPTIDKCFSCCEILIKDNNLSFLLSIHLETLAFESKQKIDFAIRKKVVQLIDFKNHKDVNMKLNQAQELIVNNFFKSYIIPDIQFSKTSKTTA